MRRLIGARRDMEMVQARIAHARRTDQQRVATTVDITQAARRFQRAADVAQAAITGQGDRQTAAAAHFAAVGQHEKHARAQGERAGFRVGQLGLANRDHAVSRRLSRQI